MAYNVGNVVTLDGIESVIIYDAGSEQEWGRYLCVDRNHDISYYLEGSDFYNINNEGKGIISLNPKYGYEWGGFYVNTGILSQAIGSGLSNTNSLISMNLPSDTEAWPVLWSKIKEFRQSYSNKWFTPTLNELQRIYEQRNYLVNLSISQSTYNHYWSSSEGDPRTACIVDFSNGLPYSTNLKNDHSKRTRLCRYTTDSELNSKKIQISTSTPQSQIYYTINNSTPTTSSTLYTDIFRVKSGTTIKAIGVKEGYLDSDVAEFVVS